jgi:hypothetical protein
MSEMKSIYKNLRDEYCTDIITSDEALMAAAELGNDLYGILISGYTEEFQNIIVDGSLGSDILGGINNLVYEMIEHLGITIRD